MLLTLNIMGNYEKYDQQLHTQICRFNAL